MGKLLLFLATAGLFGYFVWPTQYQKYDAGEGPYSERAGSLAYRVDRVSGEVFVADAQGNWKPLAVPRPDLRRPDITGPTPATRPDTQPAQRTMQEAQKVRSTTDEMTRAAAQKSSPSSH